MSTVRAASGGGVAIRRTGSGLALLSFLLVGCSETAQPEGYDPGMRFPARRDRLVLELPPVDPPGWDAPGKQDEFIAGLDALGGKTQAIEAIPPDRRKQLEQSLEAIFGTPAAPTLILPSESPGLGGLDLSPAHLAAGSRVYRRLCNQCHGLTGDGRGPTGPYVFPHPRDLRRGVYKLAARGTKPSVEDLTQTIRRGVPGTSMQPFDLISDADRNAVTAYTIYLSLRGEVEERVLRGLAADDVDDVPDACRMQGEKAFAEWTRAQSREPATPAAEGPEAIRRGFELFANPATGCVKCHQDYGRIESFKSSVWGTPVRVPDLTRGEFRWGRQPNEVASRIRHGIPAVGMPANPTLSEQQIADLSLFVRELGYPQRLPADVRDKVYPVRP